MNIEQMELITDIVTDYMKSLDIDCVMMALGPIICACIDELIEEGKLKLC